MGCLSFLRNLDVTSLSTERLADAFFVCLFVLVFCHPLVSFAMRKLFTQMYSVSLVSCGFCGLRFEDHSLEASAPASVLIHFLLGFFVCLSYV